ncbi:MAG: GerMN domain-containing protein [Lachnospiraceae bacterium]
MKKISIILSIILTLTVGMVGCGQQESAQPKDNNKDQTKTEDTTTKEKPKENLAKDNNATPDGKETAGAETPAVPTQQLKVYFMNNNADGFETEEFSITSLTPEIVIEKLIEKKALPSGIKALSCVVDQAEGQKIINLDFGDTFMLYMNNQGSTGEYYIMGSICNTFLEAFQCEKIKITVNGMPFSTGHAEYNSYMGRFE